MTMPSTSGFLERFPEFDTTSESVIALRLADALTEMSETAWGTKYERGAYLLTAHFLTLDGMETAAPGAITSRSIGDVSVSFASPMLSLSSDAYFDASKYGREYRRLQRLVASGPKVY